MDTKLKGDIAEQAVSLFALKSGWGVLRPVGDRHPYDLVLDINGYLFKIQVKSAWYDMNRNNYVCDTRRTKTNRRVMIRDNYKAKDFDFAVVYIQDLEVYYVFPAEIFNSYGSEIHLVESEKRQRKPRSASYKNAWSLMVEKVFSESALELIDGMISNHPANSHSKSNS